MERTNTVRVTVVQQCGGHCVLLVAETQAACLLTAAQGTKIVICMESAAASSVDARFVLLTSDKCAVGRCK